MITYQGGFDWLFIADKPSSMEELGLFLYACDNPACWIRQKSRIFQIGVLLSAWWSRGLFGNLLACCVFASVQNDSSVFLGLVDCQLDHTGYSRNL